ncbi:hypothetical protein [Nonomuraea sp. NPDC052265]|uniref:hypothetical protein n=1 Tax=Nonomuraea sp. NPDC052265 TaxID=3364374 RepID=UPI0037C8CAED
MTAVFVRFAPEDVDDPVAFLTDEEWPFHVGRPESVAYGILRPDWETGRLTPVPWQDEP